LIGIVSIQLDGKNIFLNNQFFLKYFGVILTFHLLFIKEGWINPMLK